jgi:hypothetical protein
MLTLIALFIDKVLQPVIAGPVVSVPTVITPTLIAAAFIAPAVIAAIVSALLSPLFIRLQKRSEYKDEYYKEMIKSRSAAYKLVESLLATLSPDSENMFPKKPFLIIFYVSIPYYVTDRNLDLSNPFLLDEDKYSEKEKESWYFNLFLSKLAEALTQEAWLSNKLYASLKALFDDLINISAVYQRINKNNYTPGVLRKLGEKHYKALVIRRDAIKPIFLENLLHLHEVQDFANKKLNKKNLISGYRLKAKSPDLTGRDFLA